MVYHAIKGDLEKYIAGKVPPSNHVASENFHCRLEHQKSWTANPADTSSNKIERIYQTYANMSDAIRPKTAIHLIDKSIVVFKLKNIPYP